MDHRMVFIHVEISFRYSKFESHIGSNIALQNVLVRNGCFLEPSRNFNLIQMSFVADFGGALVSSFGHRK